MNLIVNSKEVALNDVKRIFKVPSQLKNDDQLDLIGDLYTDLCLDLNTSYVTTDWVNKGDYVTKRNGLLVKTPLQKRHYEYADNSFCSIILPNLFEIEKSGSVVSFDIIYEGKKIPYMSKDWYSLTTNPKTKHQDIPMKMRLLHEVLLDMNGYPMYHRGFYFESPVVLKFDNPLDTISFIKNNDLW